MKNNIPGIHHVSTITGDPQANVDFYAGMLGLRLVKLTVNFDDPTTYHLYYGDSQGHPGTILPFFSWPQAMRGRIGAGQVTLPHSLCLTHHCIFGKAMFSGTVSSTSGTGRYSSKKF